VEGGGVIGRNDGKKPQKYYMTEVYGLFSKNAKLELLVYGIYNN
jgi:hypothetical protein